MKGKINHSCLVDRGKYSLLIGWAPHLHGVDFFILCPTATSCLCASTGQRYLSKTRALRRAFGLASSCMQTVLVVFASYVKYSCCVINRVVDFRRFPLLAWWQWPRIYADELAWTSTRDTDFHSAVGKSTRRTSSKRHDAFSKYSPHSTLWLALTKLQSSRAFPRTKLSTVSRTGDRTCCTLCHLTVILDPSALKPLHCKKLGPYPSAVSRMTTTQYR